MLLLHVVRTSCLPIVSREVDYEGKVQSRAYASGFALLGTRRSVALDGAPVEGKRAQKHYVFAKVFGATFCSRPCES